MVAPTPPSTSTTPLPATFSPSKAKKALTALLAHHAKTLSSREDTELLPREEHIWLIINTKRGTTRAKLMPVRIQLPHPPLPPPPVTSICLITKPPQRSYKDLLASPNHNIRFINRVVDTEKLRGKWRPFEARRNLARENDLFLCDERLVPSMPKLLGKVFFDAKKQPIPVNLKRKDLKAELGRAISSTYFHPSTGTSHSIRIATPPHTTPEQTLANLLAAAPSAVALIQDGWENVLSVGIKTSSSVLLPIWSSELDGRFKVATHGKAGEEDVEMAEDGGMRKEDGKREKKEKRKKEKTAEVEERAGVPVKKAKAVKMIPTSEPKKAEKIAKKSGKKSSSLGMGGAGKRAKEAVLGRKT